MARSLSRNTKLFVSTVDIIDTTPTSTNTYEVKILDGYSFSQGTSSEDVTVDEAGCSAVGSGTVRGTQSFNTALNPAEVSFSVYARPDKFGATDTKCPEDILWNAAFSNAIAGAENRISADELQFNLDTSNDNELLTLTLYFKYENTVYKVTNFSVDQVEVDFSIDAIASMTFSGSGSDIVEDQAAFDLMSTGTWVADSEYRAAPAADSSSFLRNKLSTVDIFDQKADTPGDTDTLISHLLQVLTLTDNDLVVDAYVGGRIYNTTIAPTGDDATWATIVSNTADTVTVSSGDDVSNWGTEAVNLYTAGEHAGITYSIPITGGSLTFANNMTYLTPEELAIVNRPLAGFTGGRTTSGTLTAYLNTGAEGSGGLLDDLLRKITEVNNNYSVTVHMGECGTTDFQVQFAMPHCNVGVPTTNVEDIISTEITFVAQEWDDVLEVSSFEDTNSLVVSYIKT